MSMSGSQNRSGLVLELAEEFLDRYRAGQRPPLKEYIDRHPELADEIREVFPAMAMMENIAIAGDPQDHDAIGGRHRTLPIPLQQLGDYRIIREVGRGGMGVVYEAEQVSLGRHVALKVLHVQMVRDAQHKRRFEREARAAARLHHTNIVPVFGFGEHEGTAYYVMQFIHGLGLDAVLDELKKARAGGAAVPVMSSARPLDPGRGDISAADMARSLLTTGRFEREDRDHPGPEGLSASPAADPHGTPGGIDRLPTTPSDPAHDATEPASDPALAPANARPPDSFSLSSSSFPIAAKGQNGEVRTRTKALTYWQGVARIGVQVADALAHAHQQGILHRDIKPSNLLLDTRGTVWLADFGLAKADDQPNLTLTGDILGTLRYMPPEAFERKSDTRGDVYSLGLTLYELLAFRPAFDEKERGRLVKQLTHEEPPRLKKLNPEVPRDLETIVQKAIERDPRHRYASADELTADLQRFLEDEPIQARPVAFWERAVKWARRRPAIAALALVVQTLLAISLGVFFWSYLQIHDSLKTARDARDRAETLARNERQALMQAEEQTQIATARAEELAWQDYISRVDRAYHEIEDNNIALAEDLLHGCPPERRGWEWHFAHRLGNLDRLTLESAGASVNAVAFSPDGRWIASASGRPLQQFMDASANRTALVELWDRETGRRRQAFHVASTLITSLAFSPDGTRIAVGSGDYGARGGSQITVWEATTGKIVWEESEPGLMAMSVAYAPDGKTLAVGLGVYSGDKVGQIRLRDAKTGEKLTELPGPQGGVNDLAFHPDGKTLAVAGFEAVEIWDVVARTKVRHSGHRRWVYAVAFSPDGRWLATGGGDRTIQLRDMNTGAEHLTIFAHEGFVCDLAFSPDSRSLASTSEDRSVRLWEVPSGRRLAVFHGHTDFGLTVAFAPDGRELASGGMEGAVKVWHLKRGRPVVFEGHSGWVADVAFRRDGRRVVSKASFYGSRGDTCKGWDPETGDLDPSLTGIDPEQYREQFMPGAVLGQTTAISRDGKLIAQITGSSVLAGRSKEYNSVVIRETKTHRVVYTLIGHTADIACAAFSPDDRRLMTASSDRTIKLWDLAGGREVFTLRGHTAGVVALAISPDGNRVASGSVDWTARVWDATPLPTEVMRAHEARIQQKQAWFEQLKVGQGPVHQGELLARAGRWAEAAAALAKGIANAPQDVGLQHHRFLCIVWAGDREAYARLAVEALARYGPEATFVSSGVAWACSLAPDVVAEHNVPVRVAEAALENVSDDWKNFSTTCLGAALFRAGRYDEAIRLLNESGEADGGPGVPQVWAFLAMAHHRKGDAAEARRWLDKLLSYRPGASASFFWDDVEVQLLRREAESVVLGGAPAHP